MTKSLSAALWISLICLIVAIFMPYAINWLTEGQNDVIEFQKKVENY